MKVAALLSIVVLSLSSACHSTAANPEIAFDRASSGQLGPSLEAKNVVARSFQEWEAFCGDRDQGMSGAARDVDWSKRMLIAVALGSRPSGGFAVEIDRVYRKGSHWIVHAHETRPAAGSFQTAMITSPFDCVATPRFEGKVEFIVE